MSDTSDTVYDDIGQEETLDGQVVEDLDGSDVEDSKECVLDADKVLFVDCLGQETTENDLANYVSKYCEVKSAQVETDPDTKQSRGVVVCGSAGGAAKVLDVGIHRINNKVVNVARGNKLCRVFVSGMFPNQHIYENDLKGYFGQFGFILKIHTQFEKGAEGFAIIYFSTEEAAKKFSGNADKKNSRGQGSVQGLNCYILILKQLWQFTTFITGVHS